MPEPRQPSPAQRPRRCPPTGRWHAPSEHTRHAVLDWVFVAALVGAVYLFVPLRA